MVKTWYIKLNSRASSLDNFSFFQIEKILCKLSKNDISGNIDVRKHFSHIYVHSAAFLWLIYETVHCTLGKNMHSLTVGNRVLYMYIR